MCGMIDKIKEWLNTPTKKPFTRQDFFTVLMLGIAIGVCTMKLLE